jgi:predicted RNA-binding protein with PIN domain
MVPTERLRSALQFAVTVANAGRAQRPPLPVPPTIRPFLKPKVLPASALPIVRDAVEHDSAFRQRLVDGAVADLVDTVGVLWLRRPDGWQNDVRELLEAEPVPAAAPPAPGRESKRREAAEAAATSARAEATELREALQRERSESTRLAAELDRSQRDLQSVRRQLQELQAGLEKQRSGTSRESARLDAAQREVADLKDSLAAAKAARDAALAQRVDQSPTLDLDVERLRSLLGEAVTLVADRRRAAGRVPLAIPGGMYGDSEAAAEHLVRSADMVVVDGYNVAMLGWPSLTLEQQRAQCIAGAERLAARWGTYVHVVFDGADVPGAHAKERRLVKVSYSPAEVLADDVLRAEVRTLDTARSVVVVTNDQAVVRDVKALGANVVSSDAFLALARR